MQIARAFTGWRYDDKHGNAFLRRRPARLRRRTFPRAGPRSSTSPPGGFGAGGPRLRPTRARARSEIDRVIDIIFDHTRLDGQEHGRAPHRLPAAASTSRTPSPAVTHVRRPGGRPTPASTPASTSPRCVRSILCHDDFYLTAAASASYTAPGKKSVKWPIDYVVEHAAAAPDEAEGQVLPDPRRQLLARILDHLTNMGQVIARSAQRVRLGLGGGLGEQRHAARALQLRARPRRRRATAAGVPAREARWT